MSVLKSPSQYFKAIVALIVSVVGALVTAGLLTGKAAIVAGAILTGLTSFVAVFGTTNKAPDPPLADRNTTPFPPGRIDPSV